MSAARVVTASTAAYGVVGWPIRHSLSPVMQAAAFNACGIDACYLAFEVGPADFSAAMDGAFRLGFSGLNVTVPHKRAAFELAVEKDVSAVETGAANTLVRCAAGWKAYNTDAYGFGVAVSKFLGFAPEGRTGVIIGAGGASRAGIAALKAMGTPRVLVAARNGEKARELSEEFGGASCGVEAVSLEAVPELISAGDLLVSATPVGLDPAGEWPWPMEKFDRGVLVYDMAYLRGGETSLVKSAAACGLRAMSGRMMLVLQGAKAFSLWTGREAPVDAMVGALTSA